MAERWVLLASENNKKLWRWDAHDPGGATHVYFRGHELGLPIGAGSIPTDFFFVNEDDGRLWLTGPLKELSHTPLRSALDRLPVYVAGAPVRSLQPWPGAPREPAEPDLATIGARFGIHHPPIDAVPRPALAT